MLSKDLFEAPLADFDTLGDLDAPGSLRADDLRAMRNPKWREKVYRAFHKTPFDFNIYVYNAPEGIAPVGRGYGYAAGDPIQVNDLKNLGQYAGIQPLRVIQHIIGKEIPNAEHSITVVLVENEGDARVSLTPWILAHRVVHAIFYAAQTDPTRGMQRGQDQKISFHVSELFSTFNTMFNAVEHQIEKSPLYRHTVRDLTGQSERINQVASLIATFRSGRTGKLSNPGEFMVEMVTQYLVKGAVTFQRPVMDDAGRTPPAEPVSDPELLALARQYPESDGKDRFVKAALHQKYRIKNAPRKPDVDRESYTAFDQDGNAIAAFGADRVERYRERGYRVERDPPPTRQAIARYALFLKRVSELETQYDAWWANGMLLPPRPTSTDRLDQQLDGYERRFNSTIATLLRTCVGKAVVL